jgi:flavin reductase (DIM6/NTAB) family NADH-FMN oxidoreductase RutF
MINKYSKEALLEGDSNFRRDFVNSLTGFKSLNLIGTRNEKGASNLAPFSQVFHIGASPPLVGILFRPHTVERHTLSNILDTGFFTLNHVHESFYKKAHQTAARYSGSEFEAVGLEEVILDGFYAPFVEISPLKIACSLADHQTIQLNQTVLVIGAIEAVWVDELAVGADGFVDLEKIGTITVTGLDAYHKTQKLARLSYPKPNSEVKEI